MFSDLANNSRNLPEDLFQRTERKSLQSVPHGCPCGYYSHPQKECRCTPLQIRNYLGRISGPLLDRIDIHIEVPPIPYQELDSERTGEPSGVIVSTVVFVPYVPGAWAGEALTMREMININTATREELVRLKRIGPSLADRIIAYREKHGPFLNTEDILNVKGLGPKFWEANKDNITVGETEAKAD